MANTNKTSAKDIGSALNAAEWRDRLAPILATLAPKATAVVIFLPKAAPIEMFPVPVFNRTTAGSVYGLVNFTTRSANRYEFSPTAHLMPVNINSEEFLAMAVIGNTKQEVLDFADHYLESAEATPECSAMASGALRIVVEP